MRRLADRIEALTWPVRALGRLFTEVGIAMLKVWRLALAIIVALAVFVPATRPHVGVIIPLIQQIMP